MAKRRISKASKRRLTLFGTASIVVIIYFVFSLIYNIYTIYDLSLEKKSLEDKYVKLQEESENLKIDIEKLNDPEYLANYAREHYLYTKPDEYKIQIEETSSDINNLESDINRNYLVLGLSVFMALIFVYIIVKGKKNKRKKKRS